MFPFVPSSPSTRPLTCRQTHGRLCESETLEHVFLIGPRVNKKGTDVASHVEAGRLKVKAW